MSSKSASLQVLVQQVVPIHTKNNEQIQEFVAKTLMIENSNLLLNPVLVSLVLHSLGL